MPDSPVGEVRELFETNRHFEALAWTRDHPLERWPWGEPAVLAARVISWLGGDRAGARLHLLNLRHAPWHDEARLYYLFRLRDSAGILKSLEENERLLREHAFAENPGVRYDVLGRRALLLAEFRDIGRALAAMDEALAALAALEEWRRRQPLLERRGQGFYHSCRADLLLPQGDLAGTREAAAMAGRGPPSLRPRATAGRAGSRR